MRTFLWFMLIVVVSGDGETVDVTTFLDEDVLLPCNCPNRNSEEELRWQTEGNLPELVWSTNKSTNYTGRVETFFNNNNCSILLKNVKKNDHKKYRCRFHVKKAYQYDYVNLRVCGPEPCQENFTRPNGVKVYTCDVKSRNSTTELQWTLDGESLKTEYKISSNFTLTDDIFHYTSTLEMNLTETRSSSVIKCKVTSPTEPMAAEIKDLPHTTVNIPALVVVLVLVTGLILLVVFILSHRKQVNKSQMEPHCSRDVEKSCFWKRDNSEGDQNGKQEIPLKV